MIIIKNILYVCCIHLSNHTRNESLYVDIHNKAARSQVVFEQFQRAIFYLTVRKVARLKTVPFLYIIKYMHLQYIGQLHVGRTQIANILDFLPAVFTTFENNGRPLNISMTG